MDIRQCKECGRLFQYMGKAICVDCADELDRMFLKVRDYIYKYPSADIAEISNKTEVDEKYILEFLKEERLSVTAQGAFLTCEQCGKPIETGRFCTGCKQSLGRAFAPSVGAVKKEVKDQEISRSTGKMHLDYE